MVPSASAWFLSRRATIGMPAGMVGSERYRSATPPPMPVASPHAVFWLVSQPSEPRVWTTAVPPTGLLYSSYETPK